MQRLVQVFPLLLMLSCISPQARAEGYVFEKLGDPVRIPTMPIRCVTRDADGRYVAWGVHEGADRCAALGVRADTGQLIWLDVGEQYGRSHIQLTPGRDGNLYLYAGAPGRFLKYDVNAEELHDLGVPARKCTYWLGSAVGPDGQFYVGSYPATHLVRCDTQSGKIEDLGRIAEDPRQSYIIHPAVDDDNVVYCPVGLHHMELYAYDAKSRAKRQILPAELTEKPGCPQVWIGSDGRAYGSVGAVKFRCMPDRIETGTTMPRRPSAPHLAGPHTIVLQIDAEGRLVKKNQDSGAITTVPTQYAGLPKPIYCVACQYKGKIYGGSGSSSHTFCYDPRSGRLEDLGRHSGGRVQVYDILSHPKGLFLTSYTGAQFDFFDPDRPSEPGVNPRSIASLSKEHQQERPIQLVLGPDDMLYSGTVPIKGHLGGALVRIDPDDFTCKVWRNIIPNQSIMYLAAVPQTGELFCASSVRGGASAKPIEKAGYVFLWDTRREEIVFRGQPIAGAAHYGAVVLADNGLLYGLSGAKYYVFDPRKREVLFTGELPVKQVRFPGLSDHPAGPQGLIMGVGDDAIFAIDPRDHQARVVGRHPSLSLAHGFYATKDGIIYYGAGSTLTRAVPTE